MVNLTLYTYEGNPQKIYKTLPAGTTITGSLYGANNVETPRIEINANDWSNNYNYIYIAQLGRFYFINTITTTERGTIILSAAVDVLFTYSEALKSATIKVTASSDPAKLDSGGVFPHLLTTHNKVIKFPSAPFDDGDSTIIMTVVRGTAKAN